MENINSKIALVTGASRGIGRAISLRLAEDGFTVVINYLKNHDDAKSLRSQIVEKGFPEPMCFQADVTNMLELKSMFHEIEQRIGHVSLLVNNAGVVGGALFLMASEEAWWRTMEVNFRGQTNCCRLALPAMISKKAGIIINMTSVSGLRGTPGQTAYSAAKAAVVGFSKALAREVSQFGISINCIAPGLIDTDMIREVAKDRLNERIQSLPVKRLGKPEEVAEVVSLLGSGRVGYLFGQVISIDGGATM